MGYHTINANKRIRKKNLFSLVSHICFLHIIKTDYLDTENRLRVISYEILY